MLISMSMQADDSVQKALTHKELDDNLSTWIEDAERRLGEVNGADIAPSDPDSINKLTDKLSELNAEISTERMSLDKLKGAKPASL